MTARVLNVVGFEVLKILVSVDTIGYEGDQEKLVFPDPDGTARRKTTHKETTFPDDMKKAYEMGKGMVLP